MAILAGFHVEGNDHLILHAWVARILGVREEEIESDVIDAPGRGWQFVLDFLPNALKRFYALCARFAVIGIDNDGNVDLDATGLAEDPQHPRHGNHVGKTLPGCRYCRIQEMVARLRPALDWLPKKPGADWPILIAVPVEMIETWLLMSQGELAAQRQLRSVQKQRLYGKPVPTRDDVINVALPLVRLMTPGDMAALAHHSPSFGDFHQQIVAARPAILGQADCW